LNKIMYIDWNERHLTPAGKERVRRSLYRLWRSRYRSWGRSRGKQMSEVEVNIFHKTTVYSFILNTVVILLGFVPASFYLNYSY